jgi:lysozyme
MSRSKHVHKAFPKAKTNSKSKSKRKSASKSYQKAGSKHTRKTVSRTISKAIPKSKALSEKNLNDSLKKTPKTTSKSLRKAKNTSKSTNKDTVNTKPVNSKTNKAVDPKNTTSPVSPENKTKSTVSNDAKQPKFKMTGEMAQIMSDEGEHKYSLVYKDSLGKPTGGIGHLILPEDNLKLGDKVSPEIRDAWFLKDYQKARKHAEKYGYKNEELTNILTNMTFQMGARGVDNFKKMHQALRKGDHNEAVNQMMKSKWAEQTKKRAERLSKRMKDLAK